MDFDFQWKYLPSKALELNSDRIAEVLNLTQISHKFFEGKSVLDVGSGSGRYTYAFQQLGADVMSIDGSQEAIKLVKQINPDSYLIDFYSLSDLDFETMSPYPTKYDFVWCWGVLNHIKDPIKGFKLLVEKVKPGGMLHIMVYNNSTQAIYKEGRELFKTFSTLEKLEYIFRHHGNQNTHGWWDAYNPTYNHSFHVEEVIDWFSDFKAVKVTKHKNINIQGVKN